MHQTPCSAQPEAQTAAGGVTVAECPFYVWDAGALVGEGQAQSVRRPRLQDGRLDLPPPPWTRVLRASSLAAVTSLV